MWVIKRAGGRGRRRREMAWFLKHIIVLEDVSATIIYVSV